MRIAFLCYEFLQPGGIGVYSRRLISELTSDGHKIVVFCAPANPDLSHRIPLLSEVKQVPVSGLPLTSMLSFWTRLPIAVARERVRGGPFDVVHSNAIADAFLSKRRLPGPRIVTVFHLGRSVVRSAGLRVMASPRALRTEYGLALAVEGRSIRRADQLIVISDSTRREVQAAFPDVAPGKVSVIPPGVDTQIATSDEKTASYLRSKWGISRGNKILLFVGRIKDRKGLPLLLKVLKQLEEESAKLVIVGGGDGSRIARTAQKMGIGNQVILAGYVSDQELRAAYSISQVLVHPSVMEGYGMTLAESVYLGLPVVAFGVGAIPEVVQDGVNGFLVEYPNVSAFARAVRRVLSVGLEGPQNATLKKPRFDWRLATVRTLAAYERSIDTNHQAMADEDSKSGS